MKSLKKTAVAVLSMITAVSLTACGGGSSSTPVVTTTTPSTSQGVITALGSIFVNGVEYNVDNATIKIDDNTATKAQLHEGMVVKVRGTDDGIHGVATHVEVRDVLEGTIDDKGVDTITVMGQVVQIEDNITRLNDDNTVKTFAQANFQIGEHVEVHGFADDLGKLRATRVLKKTVGTEFEAKGFITSLDNIGKTFTLSLTKIGTTFLTVTFTGTLPAGAAVGSIVEVRSAVAPATGAVTIAGTAVTLEDRIGVAGDKVEVEGIVNSGTLADFFINGKEVITNSSTVFQGGVAADFALGVKLEAQGSVNAAGAIVATKIEFRSSIKIVGDALSVTATSLTVLGQNVAIDATTKLDNGLPASGAHIELRAIRDRNGSLVATRIRTDNSNKFFAQAPVTAFDATAGTMSILGINAKTDGATQFRVSTDSTEAAVLKAVFFGKLTTGVTIVKVRWNTSDTTLAIEEAEIELGK